MNISIGHSFRFASLGCHALAGFLAFLMPFAAAQADPVSFQFNVVDPAGQGFNDPLLGPQRLAAVQYAGQLWGGLLKSSYAGETVRINLSMDNSLGGLAAAGGGRAYHDFSGLVPGTWYASSIANHVFGGDIEPQLPEFVIRYTPNIPWYYGTDAHPPAIQFDFVTTTLGLIEHGLGFDSRLFRGDGTYVAGPSTTEFPGIYDRFLTTGATNGTALTEMSVAERASAITSDNLYWMGQYAVGANGGERPKLWAPGSFESGVSIVNLDANVFPMALVHAGAGIGLAKGEVRRPTLVELVMLRDLGWTVVPEPNSATILVLATACLSIVGSRPFQLHRPR